MSAPLPEGLRLAIERDLAPVRPLPRPEVRAAAVALPMLAAMAVVAMRHHAPVTWEGLGPPTIEWALASGLTALALREAVPGRSLGSSRVVSALGIGAAAYLTLAALSWRAGGFRWSGAQAVLEAFGCGSMLGRISLVPLTLATWLAVRALPLRPGRSGALAGAAAGLFADAIWRVICHRSDLVHQGLGHGGAVLLIAGVGALAGYLLSRGRSTAR